MTIDFAHFTPYASLSGGILIDSFTVPAGGSSELDLTILNTELLPDSIFTIAGRTIQGGSAEMTAAIAWKEIK